MPDDPAPPPVFRDLTDDEVDALLSRHHVGRFAFSFRDLVDIRPMHYVYRDGWIYGRTSPSDKLVTLRHNQWVAFEIDESRGMFDWQSVVARGTFYCLCEEGTEHDRRLYEQALKALRELQPEALTESDPVPFRTKLFAIHLDSRTGRSSSTMPDG